jgi:hypothetical protein
MKVDADLSGVRFPSLCLVLTWRILHYVEMI